jgi:hypothetical protein
MGGDGSERVVGVSLSSEFLSGLGVLWHLIFICFL